MPHRRRTSPAPERITGLTKIWCAGTVTQFTEGIALWHEQDDSRSSTEQIALAGRRRRARMPSLPDHGLIQGLVVNQDRMLANLEIRHRASSMPLKHPARTGEHRDIPGDYYALVQAAAMRTSQDGTPLLQQLGIEAASARRHAGRRAAGRRVRPGAISRPAGQDLRRARAADVSRISTRERQKPSSPCCAPGRCGTVFSLGNDVPLLVTSDQVSALDRIAADAVPAKGSTSTQLSLSVDSNNSPTSCRTTWSKHEIQAEFAGQTKRACRGSSPWSRSMRRHGYLVGNKARASTRRAGRSAGVPLPAGLLDGSQLAEPRFTAATKAPRPAT